MKNTICKILLLCFISLLFEGCFLQKETASKSYSFTVTNPSAIERADELVTLSRNLVEQKTGKLKQGGFISVTDKENQPVPVQFDDLNKDGIWDEAVFLYTFQPNETAHLHLKETNLPSNESTVRAHVRMRKKNTDNTFGPLLDSVTVPRGTVPTDFTKQKLPPYLTEGPAWENDKVAFRIYMDTRNTKDIFGKTTTTMMMDTVGVIPENSYHNKADWGMDILAVGKSLGAGSLALSIIGDNGKDTLVRLGGNNIEQTTFEKVADGPIRAVFRMHYKNFIVSNSLPPVNVTEEISIWAGKYYYQSKVTVSNAPANTRLVTGIVNLKSKKSNQLTVENCKILYSYDVQSENKDNLGLAILVRNNNSVSGTTPNAGSDVLNTYTVSMPVTTSALEYRFVSGWELSDLLFTKEESFRKFLENEAVKYGRNVIISMQ